MTTEEKDRLIDTLHKTYNTVLSSIEGVDPETQINPETDWRIRDIIGHLAVWDREVAKSIRAFQRGDEYSIPDFTEGGFNDHERQEQRKRSVEAVFSLWEQERREFVAVVKDLPVDRFGAEFLYPWGDERGDVGTLVDYMIEHDVEHRTEIEKALRE